MNESVNHLYSGGGQEFKFYDVIKPIIQMKIETTIFIQMTGVLK